MRLFYKLLLAALLLPGLGIKAQTLQQVIIANGGVWGPSNMVRMAAYDPSNGNYTIFDSIPASSVQDVVIDGRRAYVAADSLVIQYDLDSYQRTAQASVPGVRKLAVAGNTVYATQGFGNDGTYLKALGGNTLTPLWSISGLSGDCEGVAVVGDTVYVAVPGSFGASRGYLGLVDIPSQSLVQEIDLDSMGRGISRLFVHNRSVYSINTIEFASPYGVVTKYDIDQDIVVNTTTPFTLRGGYDEDNGVIFCNYLSYFGTFDVATGQADTLFNKIFAAAEYDPGSAVLYGTETDYQTYGRLLMYDLTGVLLDSLDIGISPEAIALDYGVATQRPEPETIGLVKTWPNPVAGTLHADLSELAAGTYRYAVLDLAGRALLNGEWQAGARTQTLDLSPLAAGTYFLRISGDKGQLTQRIVRQ